MLCDTYHLMLHGMCDLLHILQLFNSKYIAISLAKFKELYPGDFGKIYSVVP